VNEIAVPDLWLGMCPECLQSKHFTSERARDLWERHHPHEEWA
jgi:hypothetical protein